MLARFAVQVCLTASKATCGPWSTYGIRTAEHLFARAAESPAEEKAADEAVAPAAAMNTSNDRVTPESAQTDLTGKDKTAMDSGETSTGKRARDLDSEQESDEEEPCSPKYPPCSPSINGRLACNGRKEVQDAHRPPRVAVDSAVS